jgi:predicted RNA binding protein YcfA (HicA-like mRNA interferase family)
MAGLPVVSGVKGVRAFERAGWRQGRRRGSHVVLLKTSHNASLSVPNT